MIFDPPLVSMGTLELNDLESSPERSTEIGEFL